MNRHRKAGMAARLTATAVGVLMGLSVCLPVQADVVFTADDFVDGTYTGEALDTTPAAILPVYDIASLLSQVLPSAQQAAVSREQTYQSARQVMARVMSQQNQEVLVNIIGAMESGGQVYGNRRYNAYAGARGGGEVTCTLGWAQNYGSNAQELVQEILLEDQASFLSIDTNGIILEKLLHNWTAEQWNPSEEEKNILISLIDSDAGHRVQDRRFMDTMARNIAECVASYGEDVSPRALIMYCEIRHLGGQDAAKRIFNRCQGLYTMDNIMLGLFMDYTGNPGNTKVGGQMYWQRHSKCRTYANQYATVSPEQQALEDASAAVRAEMMGDVNLGDGNTVILGLYNASYTGGEVYENVYVFYKGCILYRDEYAVHYQNNVEPGIATIIIAGKGNYAGEATANFLILPPGMQ